jgi:pilus assembly protein FimV
VRTISVAILAGILGLAAPFAAQAAGLGRLTVLSPLGSPLNAEIEIVSLQSGEEDGLSARLASADAYRQAGIEPSSALRTVRFAIVKRDGRPVLRVTSTAPVNEPFMDLLVDLEWNGGRLTREYTVLLDPPELKGPQTIAAAPQKPEAPSAQPLPPLEATPKPQAAAPVQDSGAPVQDSAAAVQDSGAPVENVPAPVQGQGAPVQDVRAKPERLAGANGYDVKRGDTLGAIARANLPQGVSLNQMMIAIYRANPDAFLRENINLVRAGRTLNIPSADELSGVGAEEANRLVQAHRTEWEDYRSRLAAAPTGAETASGRAVTGKIEGKSEAGAPGAAEDQVRLSKADPAKPGAAGRAARADDAAARERALKEAQSRVTDLEKNVADLQKLLELKNQQLAELEKKSAKPAAKAEPAKPEPAKPAAPPVVAQAPAPSASAPAPGASAPIGAAPQPEAKKAEPAPEAKKAEPSPEAKKAEPAKPKAKAAPPPPPPSLLDEFLDNPVALAGLGAVAVLLLGYALWSWRRKKSNQAKFSDSVLGPGGGTAPSLNDSRSGASGSQASVSQTSGMEAEEVDPIAEADVYMAYGRDAQAEEILKEALQKNPNRIPVHAKLLEIYAKRNDTRAFEQTALKLKSLTNGSGADWDKAAALGRSIDPGNGLYGGASSAGAMAAAPAAAAFAGAAAAAPSIDFDIGGGTSPGLVTTDIPLDQSRPATPSTIDFDLGAGSTPNSMQVPDPDATIAAIDFNLDAEPTKKPAPASAPAPAAVESASTASGLDFDLNLDLGDQSASATKSIPSMDLSSISLDLGSAGEPGGSTSSNDPKWQEVATKLDLAKAYEEMGDKDGARELLGEVMKDGDATQKGQAQQLLSKLG